SGPDEDIGKIETVFAAAIGQAKDRVRIVTPYFLPDERLKSAIGLAALRGVDVEVIIPEKSDLSLLDWAMRAHLAFFPLKRMHCYQTPEPFDHSKLMTVDGRWCAVGSPNWDVRSLRLNFELLLECYDEQMVAGLDRTIDERIARARSLTSDDLAGRTLAARLRDASARMLLPYL
ncbi:MAG TPA: phospholipase D-like domain-containing protein, partial [Afifellaceae bacterium]|nr:phospholipase D-like domain-containing protein [Afifellaceae bacterium]